MKLSLQDFQKEILDMYRDSIAGFGMISDEDDFVIRYWGTGDESQHYNLILKDKARDYRQLVHDEREILLSRGKKAAWWKVHDFPSGTRTDLENALPLEGFHLFRKARLLYLPIDKHVTKASSVEVKKMKPHESFDFLKEISMEVWGEVSDPLLKGLKEEIQSADPKTQIYFSRIRGESEWASVGWIRFYSKIGFLFGGSTKAKFRSMGTYRTLVATRMEAAAAAGMKYVLSECTPESERVLRGLGFEDAGVATVYEFKAG